MHALLELVRSVRMRVVAGQRTVVSLNVRDPLVSLRATDVLRLVVVVVAAALIHVPSPERALTAQIKAVNGV